MKAQADALEGLAQVKSELEKYQSTFGPLATMSPDLAQLKEQLQSKESEIQQLRLLETQGKAVCFTVTFIYFSLTLVTFQEHRSNGVRT